MRVLKWIYEKKNKKEAPYYYNYSIFTIIFKPIRKWLTNTVAANCPFNCIRIGIYHLCGFEIGKHTFIGMKCYLDDMCYDLLKIGNNVTISYGVFFACHGRNQAHLPIIIKDNVYIGMRANVISLNREKSEEGVCIEEGAVIGACALVNCNIPAYATAVGIPCKIIKKEEKDE